MPRLGIAQEIKINPKFQYRHFMGMNSSPSGSYIAARLSEDQNISIFETFSGKEINRVHLDKKPSQFYFLDDKFLLIVYNNSIQIININDNVIVTELPIADRIFVSDFHFKTQVLAIFTQKEITTVACKNNQLKVLANTPAKTPDTYSKLSSTLSISEDGSSLAALQDDKILCWNTNTLALKGSIDAKNITAFEAAGSYIVVIEKEPFSYRYYSFTGSPIAGGKPFRNVAEPYAVRVNGVGDHFFLEAYKQVVFIDSEGYQTVIKTESPYAQLEFNAATGKIITLHSHNISIMDFEGATYSQINAKQLLSSDLYYNIENKKHITALDSQLVFSIDGKDLHKKPLSGKYAGSGIEKDNWLILPMLDGQIDVWDIKTEKLLYNVKNKRIPYLMVPDKKNKCLYVSNFIDSAIYKYDLLKGTRSEVYKDNSSVTAISLEDDILYIGNTKGEVKVLVMQPDRIIVKHKAAIFGNGISTLSNVNDKLLIASFGRIGYLKSDLSDSLKPTLFIGHNGLIKKIDISPEKNFFISTADDKTIKLWDLKGTQLLQSYNLDSASADRLQIVNNNEYLFYGSEVLIGAIIDTITTSKFINLTNEIVVQSPNNNAPLKLAIDKEGSILASVDNNTVKVRDLRNGFLISEFTTESKTINGITFSTDGKMIVVAAGNAIEFFDPLTGKLIRRLDLGKRGRSVHDVEAYNNAIVAINSHGWHNPLIFHKNSGLKLDELYYNPGDEIDKRVMDFKATPTGSLLITYGSHFLKIYKGIQNLKNPMTIPLSGTEKTNSNYIDFMNISPDEKYLLYLDFTDVSVLKIIDIANGKLLQEHNGGIGAFGKDGKYLYVVGNNRIGVRDIHGGTTRILDFECDGNINNITYNDKTDIFAISDTWGNIKILEGRSGIIISQNSRWDQYTYNTILSPNGQYVLFNNRWGLYTLDFNNLQRDSIPAENFPLAGVFAPTSDKLYFRKDNTFFVKDLHTGNIDSVFTTNIREKDIQNVGISNDGKMLYFKTASDDIIFISIEARKQIRSINTFKIDGLDGFQLRDVVFKDGKYEMIGVGIKTYGNESGLTHIRMELNDKLNFIKISPEIKLTRGEAKSFEEVVFLRDAKIFDISEDEKYFCYMKNLKLHLADVKSGDIIFTRDNPISGQIQSAFFSDDQKTFTVGFDDGYVEVYDLKKQSKDFNYAEKAVGLFQAQRFKANQSGISNMQLAGNRLLVKGNNAFASSFSVGNHFNKELDMDFIKDRDQIFIHPDGYYYSTKNALNFIAFKRGNSIYPFEQFDIKYNRPDKLLAAVSSTDTALTSSYRLAYYKRIKKLHITENANLQDNNIPEAVISNRQTIPLDQTNSQLKLAIKASDNKYNLDRINIWINDVPLWGMNGYSIRSKKTKGYDTAIVINLSKGQNKIEVEVSNTNSTASLPTPLMVNYSPLNKIKEQFYFIGIGIDQFANNKYNLKYCSKDIHDLAIKLKEKYGDNIIIDTLFNEKVTVANIKAIKKRLMQTNENDKVMISYSGHGLLSKDYDYFLSTYSINFEKPEQNGLPYDELEYLLDSIPARRKLMLIDACHSGEVDKEDLSGLNTSSDSLTKGGKVGASKKQGQLGLKNSFELMQSLFINVGKTTGATIISAAAGTQFAQESNNLKNGVFTYSILEAMQKYPSIKLSELKRIVGERVQQLTNGQQKPTSRTETIAVDWDVW
jgi:WD40 repeat protein